MSKPYLGYAVVINNLSSDVRHWVLDAECIKSALDTVGFRVKAYNDCNVQVSSKISKLLIENSDEKPPMINFNMGIKACIIILWSI